MKKGIIVTIDGPSSAGKGTIAKSVSKVLGLDFLDTGAMYRCVALLVKEYGFILDDNDITKLKLKNSEINFINDHNDEIRVILNGNDVTLQIRTPEISKLSSDIATKNIVREYLTDLQREYASRGNIVAEGRDMGTYVFPDADYKFYLDASIKERAKRRLKQLEQSGIESDIDTVLKDLEKRDEQDENRSIAPLHPATNAVIIDTTELSINQVEDLIINRIKGVYN